VRRPDTSTGVVIAGGGPAAWSCAFALRKRGYDGTVELLCDEPRAPYDRTMVSKDCLERSPAEGERSLSPSEAYAEAGVTLRLGARAVALEPGDRTVGLADGSSVVYEDGLLVATGGRPRLPAPLSAPGVHVLRTLADAQALGDALAGAERLAIVGGGFIAGEVATTAAARGLEVTMLEALAAPLARVVGPEVGARVADLHRRAGVDLRVRSAARRVIALRRGYVIELEDGAALSADVVVVAIGMAPNVDWLSGVDGLTISDGVVTDECCRTGVPGVFAAGDCARWWNRRSGALSRVEHWDTAVRHGQAAAASILGEGEPFTPVPFVWSMQHGSRLQWVGDAAGWDDVELDDRGSPHGLTARYWRRGELCGAFAIDEPRAIATVRRELTHVYKAGA
jgi:3-phenylpropionate/trans-cinnamate dioxygenase ferredoxin reductase subunit